MGATFHLNRRHCGIFRLPGSQVGHNLDTGNVVVWLIVKSFGEPKQGILYDHIIVFQGDTKTVSSSPSQLAFVRVFCGPSAQVRIFNNSSLPHFNSQQGLKTYSCSVWCRTPPLQPPTLTQQPSQP